MEQKTITVDMKPGLYPPQAVDSFIGQHFAGGPERAEEPKWQGVIVAADYIKEDDHIRLTVKAVDI